MPDAEAEDWARRVVHHARRSRFNRCALDRDEAGVRLNSFTQDLDFHMEVDRWVPRGPSLQCDDGVELCWAICESLREYYRVGDYDSLSPAERELYYETSSGQSWQTDALEKILSDLIDVVAQYWLAHSEARVSS